MKTLSAFLMAMLVVFPIAAMAEPPMPLQVVETVTIQASAAEVWARAKNFDGLATWHPLFARSELVSGVNGMGGAIRSVRVKDGPAFTEELLEHSDREMTFTYRIVESPLPLRDYFSTFSVTPGPAGAVVKWSGSFMRRNPASTPPPGEDDAAAIKLVEVVYRTGLDNLKRMLEGKEPPAR
jgi:hypothetical protein